MRHTVIQPPTLVDPRPRYSQGVLTSGGRLLFIAGQTAVDAEGRLVGKGDPEGQAEQVFDNVRAVLTAAGAGFEHLVKTTTYLTDVAYREALNKVRRRYLGELQPASTLVIVKALAHEDHLIEIDGIAVI